MKQRLSEKFWRTFIQILHDRFTGVSASDDFLPTLQVFDDALIAARMPQPEQKNGTVSAIDIFIGSETIDPEQAIKIPVKYSKATMKARPPALSRAWRPAIDLQAPLHPNAQRPYQTQQSQLLSSYIDQQSQTASQGKDGAGAVPSDIAGMISSEVKGYSTYVVKKEQTAPPPSQGAGMDGSQVPVSQRAGTQPATQADGEELEEEEEEVVAKEDLVKAWRFGSTWVPVEADTFEPLATQKGVEILGFFPRANVRSDGLSRAGRETADGSAEKTPSYGRGAICLAGPHQPASADQILVLGRRHDAARDGGRRSMGVEEPVGTRDWRVHPRAGLSGRR